MSGVSAIAMPQGGEPYGVTGRAVALFVQMNAAADGQVAVAGTLVLPVDQAREAHRVLGEALRTFDAGDAIAREHCA